MGIHRHRRVKLFEEYPQVEPLDHRPGGLPWNLNNASRGSRWQCTLRGHGMEPKLITTGATPREMALSCLEATLCSYDACLVLRTGVGYTGLLWMYDRDPCGWAAGDSGVTGVGDTDNILSSVVQVGIKEGMSLE
ncbi:hypothetical protein FGB62_57g29 [Gracilaria domingensis]|nr:hypothetical protein FGB62_57g29 [Gracilaria domingensis]